MIFVRHKTNLIIKNGEKYGDLDYTSHDSGYGNERIK